MPAAASMVSYESAVASEAVYVSEPRRSVSTGVSIVGAYGDGTPFA